MESGSQPWECGVSATGSPGKSPCITILIRSPTWCCFNTIICRVFACLCPTLCDPMDCSPPVSSVHGIFQARILEWLAISHSTFAEQIIPKILAMLNGSNLRRFVHYFWDSFVVNIILRSPRSLRIGVRALCVLFLTEFFIYPVSLMTQVRFVS